MSLLWAVPPVAVVVGALILLGYVRSMAGAAADLLIQLQRLDEVRLAVAQVRTASAETRAAMRSLQR